MNRRFGCLPIVLFLLLLLLLPFVFVQVMSLALEKLRLSPQVALLLMLGIFIGSVVNIPIKRIVRHEDVMTHPFPLFGFLDTFPHLQRVRRETVIAVNLGGCLIPTMVAVYEIWQLLLVPWTYLLIIGLAVAVNTAVCYWMAQPVKRASVLRCRHWCHHW